MKTKIAIRDETDADVDAITEVTVAAFETLEVSNQTGQFIIAALRAANALTISLVVELDGRVVGHPQYYRKFGFENVTGLAHEGVPPEVFFALSFDGHTPQGTVTFHDAFKAED